MTSQPPFESGPAGLDSLTSFLECAPDPAVVADEQDRIVVVNHSAETLFGYRRFDLVGRPLRELVPAITHGDVESPSLDRSTVVAKHADGHSMRLSVAFRAVPHEHQHLTAAYFQPAGSAGSPDLAAATLDRVPVPIARFDREQRLIYGNLALVAALGVRGAELLGKRPELWTEADATGHWCAAIGRCLSTGATQHADLVLGAARRSYSATIMAERDRAGAVASALVTLADTSERRQATQLLETIESRFRLVTEGSQDLISQHSADGTFRYASAAARTILERSPEELIGRQLLDSVHPDDRDNVRRSLADSSVREAGHLTSFRLVRPSGATVWCEMAAHWSVTLPDGSPTITCIIRDVTERVRGEEILRGASRMEATATLAAGVAHDFNNLMTAILGNAELLLADPTFPDAPSRLTQVAEAARRGGALAQQLLAYARGGKYQAQTVSVNDLVREVFEFQKRTIPPRVQLEANLDPGNPCIEADPVQISQVLTNLCINGAEAIPGSGRISIRTRAVMLGPDDVARMPGLPAGPTVSIEVADTGKGIEAAALPRIFEPFFSTKFQGRGLGLAAAYGIVKNHRGFIGVDSTMGRGTTFRIYLPAVTAEPRPPAPVREPFPTGQETLLLVDDDEAVLEVTKSILERLRYNVLVARHGVEAVEVARRHEGPIDLALLDMGMPLAGGAEAFPFLKAARPEMRILIASGYELNDVIQGLLASGADAFLQKPYRLSALARGIRQVLDRRVTSSRLED